MLLLVKTRTYTETRLRKLLCEFRLSTGEREGKHRHAANKAVQVSKGHLPPIPFQLQQLPKPLGTLTVRSPLVQILMRGTLAKIPRSSSLFPCRPPSSRNCRFGNSSRPLGQNCTTSISASLQGWWGHTDKAVTASRPATPSLLQP